MFFTSNKENLYVVCYLTVRWERIRMSVSKDPTPFRPNLFPLAIIRFPFLQNVCFLFSFTISSFHITRVFSFSLLLCFHLFCAQRNTFQTSGKSATLIVQALLQEAPASCHWHSSNYMVCSVLACWHWINILKLQGLSLYSAFFHSF